MSDFFGTLTRRADANARRAVEVYARELPEWSTIAASDREQPAPLDFAVLLRRRSVELASHDQPFTDDDLAVIASVGHARGRAGVSLDSARRVLGLHTTLMMQEMHEAAGDAELDELLRMLTWLGQQGTSAQDSYIRGFLDGQRHFLPDTEQVQQLAAALLGGDPAAELALQLNMPAASHYTVTVVRIADPDFRPAPATRAEILRILIDTDRVPMSWNDRQEFVVLLPAVDQDQRRALRLVAAFAESVGRPCAVGATTASVSALPGALSLARNISQAAPVERVPRRVTTIADVFVELGATRLPEVDHWLHQVAHGLSQGPDLVATLDAYYRHDMNRKAAADHLYVHPRTLDYRLRRTRELTGIDPATTHGVRTLSATVTRILSNG
ncbi:helix-turn-helix domain-containing protein [Spirillospora sp. NPDC047279]|uniref:PucR family transcriptional regulator n=1 Tax=Spirillospora sp. NPDC047279 TaxID=3155478 RepID=UPI0033DDA112